VSERAFQLAALAAPILGGLVARAGTSSAWDEPDDGWLVSRALELAERLIDGAEQVMKDKAARGEH
jgi:hypothetical protein